MILRSRLPKLCQHAAAATRVLDVGGWYQPFNLATDVIDIMPWDTRRRHEALDPEHDERFTRDSWTTVDICDGMWPFADDSFDFVICSHTLEDVRDPIHVCREIGRVGRAGYIEVPSVARELFCKRRLPRLAWLSGRAPEVGFNHHRWFCELDESGLLFTAKTTRLLEYPRFYIRRSEIGRKLTEEESGLDLWWSGGVRARERVIVEGMNDHLMAIRATTISHLRSSVRA